MNIFHRLGSADPKQVATATFGGLSAIQEHSPEAQVMAACLLAKLLCDSYQVQYWAVSEMLNNFLGDANVHTIPEVKALDAFITHEFLPKVKR